MVAVLALVSPPLDIEETLQLRTRGIMNRYLYPDADQRVVCKWPPLRLKLILSQYHMATVDGSCFDVVEYVMMQVIESGDVSSAPDRVYAVVVSVVQRSVWKAPRIVAAVGTGVAGCVVAV